MSATNNLPPILGLTGAIGAGKDTVADIMAAQFGARVTSFAAPLRREVAGAFGIDPRLLGERHLKELPTGALSLRRCMDLEFIAVVRALHAARGEACEPHHPRSPRQIMQWWGTDYCRAQDPLYWMRKLTATVRRLAADDDKLPIVIADVRFANEANLVRTELGATLWRIVRPGHRAGSAQAQQHASEIESSHIVADTTINNRHDIRHLQGVVVQAWADALREARQ